MNITNLRPLLLIAALTGSAFAKDEPFEPVEKAVSRRTRQEVRWLQDVSAREDAAARARAIVGRPLTISGAVQVALLNNRELQATFEEIGLSFADLRQARLLSNPEADFSIKFPDQPPTAAAYEWGIVTKFVELLMIPLRTRIAREQLAATQLRVSDEVVKLVGEVKVAYREAQSAEGLLTKLRALQTGQGTSLQLMQKLHEAGNVPDLSLLREQAAYSQARLETARADAEQRQSREKLNRLLGLWGAETNWKLAGELPIVPASAPSVAGLETLAVANRLDLAAARADLDRAVRSLGLEKAFRFIGALDFGVEGERESDKTRSIGPSFRLQIPLFDQGQARVARGEAQLRMAHRKFEGLAIDIRSRVRELRERMLSTRNMAEFYRDDLLPTRRQITAHTLAQYNAMLVGAFEAFQARRDEVDAERGLIEATRDYWIAHAELERAVGGDLNPPREWSEIRNTTTGKAVAQPKRRKP